jgi:hypothetical protein
MPALNKIKNALLRYSLCDINGDFENLTMREKSIVGSQKNLDVLIDDIKPDDVPPQQVGLYDISK